MFLKKNFMPNTLKLGNREVKYALKKSRRARHLRVAVRCDATVVVTAPAWLPEYKIEKFLQAKIGWIFGKVEYFRRAGFKSLGGYFGRGRTGYKKYKEQAREFILEKIKKINQYYNFSFSRIAVKNNKTSWGSCSKKNNLNFNYKLIFLPVRLAEYIVAHELCHLKEFNHSKKFWNLVRESVPDFKERRRELKKYLCR